MMNSWNMKKMYNKQLDLEKKLEQNLQQIVGHRKTIMTNTFDLNKKVNVG